MASFQPFIGGTASVTETVGCRDDIMLYLISKGLDPKMSFKIMESVRKGKVKKGGFEEGLFQISCNFRFTLSNPAQQYSASKALARMENWTPR